MVNTSSGHDTGGAQPPATIPDLNKTGDTQAEGDLGIAQNSYIPETQAEGDLHHQ